MRDGAAEVLLGDTRVLAVASGELVSLLLSAVAAASLSLTTPPLAPHQATPFPDRPSEGQFALSVEFSPMASPEFEPGRGTDAAVELSRFLERGLKQSGASDTPTGVGNPAQHALLMAADRLTLARQGRWIWKLWWCSRGGGCGPSASTSTSWTMGAVPQRRPALRCVHVRPHARHNSD